MKLNFRYLVTLFASGLLVSGCSFIGLGAKSDGEKAPERLSTKFEFKQTVSPTANPVPEPVEVATEFNELVPQAPTLANGMPAPLSVATAPGEKPAPGSPSLAQEPAANVAQAETSDVGPAATPQQLAAAGKKGGPRGRGPFKRGTHVVRPGDTLMKISFEQFGNVYRWREILKTNKDKIPDFNHLITGTVLRIEGTDYVVVQKNGTPYFIKRADTLVKISRAVYGEPTFWRELWKNNPQLIHDPNKIYAGFTLYYLDKGKMKQVPPTPLATAPAAPAPATTEERAPASPETPAVEAPLTITPEAPVKSEAVPAPETH